jgi:hypothetical protein
LCEFFIPAGNAQKSVEMEELQRNKEENQNYNIGVPFKGLEDTRSHHKEDGTHEGSGPAGRWPMKEVGAHLLESSHNRL